MRGWSVQEFHPVTGRVACTNTRSPERASSWSRVAARVNAHACASALWLGLIGVCCGTPTCASAITAGSHGRELRAARGAVARGKPAASVQPGRLCARAPPAASAGSCTRVHALCCAYMCNTHRWRHGIARARVRACACGLSLQRRRSHVEILSARARISYISTYHTSQHIMSYHTRRAQHWRRGL